MQISKALIRNKIASVLFRRRLTLLLIAILLLIAVVLVYVQGSPQNPATVFTEAGTGGSGSGDPLSPLPEYGFSGGGVVVLAICFAAFALFVKRGKIGKR